ncbi:MAG: oxaloacetate decarboxylase [Oscillospiraceae bacterium]|nr:oxaloacetate decarboxylase [Oscillospiraceae bacterium]
MKKVRTIFIILGILFLIIGTAGCIYMRLHNENTAIIGGADTPTFIFLAGKGDFLPFLSPILIIVSVVFIIVSVILKLKRK